MYRVTLIADGCGLTAYTPALQQRPEQTPYENYEREDAAANRRDGAILLGMAACTGGSSSRTTSIAKVAPLLCMRSCSSTD